MDGCLNIYSKQYLHPDEQLHFSTGIHANQVLFQNPRIVPAICFEIAQESHISEAPLRLEPDIYLASVAKTEAGIIGAQARLQEIAQTYSVYTMIVNGLGESGEGMLCGRSAVWGRDGKLIDIMSAAEGILRFDLQSQMCNIIYVSH